MVDEIAGKTPNDLTLYVDGKEITVESARFLRTLDTCADACNVTFPWFPGDDLDIDSKTKPFSYSPTGLYLGGNLQMEGILYNSTHKLEKSGRAKDLEIYSKTADIIDSTVIPPYEAANISLKDRCKQQCEPFKIDVLVGEGVDLTQIKKVQVPIYEPSRINRIVPFYMLGIRQFPQMRQMAPSAKIEETQKFKTVVTREEQKFSRVSAEQTEKIFGHLKKLAAQVGVLLSCTKNGDLLLIKPNVNGKSIGTINEEHPSGDNDKYLIEFNGRERWSRYRAIATSSKHSKAAKVGVAKDDVVRAPRILTFRADDSIPGEALNCAEWRRNKAAADSLSIPFPVNSWYGPDNNLWCPNTKVTVVSPTIGAKDGFDFLISQVEFRFEKSGTTAILKLIPPTMFTTAKVEEPWL